jgi:hypothetical protein
MPLEDGRCLTLSRVEPTLSKALYLDRSSCLPPPETRRAGVGVQQVQRYQSTPPLPTFPHAGEGVQNRAVVARRATWL